MAVICGAVAQVFLNPANGVVHVISDGTTRPVPEGWLDISSKLRAVSVHLSVDSINTAQLEFVDEDICVDVSGAIITQKGPQSANNG